MSLKYLHEATRHEKFLVLTDDQSRLFELYTENYPHEIDQLYNFALALFIDGMFEYEPTIDSVTGEVLIGHRTITGCTGKVLTFKAT